MYALSVVHFSLNGCSKDHWFSSEDKTAIEFLHGNNTGLSNSTQVIFRFEEVSGTSEKI